MENSPWGVDYILETSLNIFPFILGKGSEQSVHQQTLTRTIQGGTCFASSP